MGKLSQAIADGDGISILVEVEDSRAAQAAEAQGADALACRGALDAVRASSRLPLLALGSVGSARDGAADAVAIEADPERWEEGSAHGLECVIRVSEADDLRRALSELDAEVFLLAAERAPDDDPLEALLELLHDVPAGKLAIAELHDATADDVAELERSGIDVVLVAPGDLTVLVPAGPPDV